MILKEVNMCKKLSEKLLDVYSFVLMETDGEEDVELNIYNEYLLSTIEEAREFIYEHGN